MILPPHRRGRVGSGENPSGASSDKASQGQNTELPLSVSEATSISKKGKQVEFTLEPTHPYSAALDATYSSASEPTRPAAKDTAPGRLEANYQNTAKVYDPQIAKVVYKRVMETPITITQRELLSLALKVWT